MSILKIKASFSPNPRLEPLLDGTVRIPGVEIEWKFGRPPDLHLASLTQNADDIFEFSLSNLLITRDQPAERERLQWMAIPIFLTKAFNWLDRFYVRVDSNITSLADLGGKRVGVPDYHMSATLWMRIVLRQLYDIRPEDIEWFNCRPPGVSHGTAIGATLAPGIRLKRARQAGELEAMLSRGEFDAAYGDSLTKETLAGTDSVRPLFKPGEAALVMGEYRRQTGMTPTNHVLIVQRCLVDAYPELPLQLYRAFEESKQEAYNRARRAAAGYLLFAKDVFAGQAALFGDDPFPSGLAANRNMLATIASESLAEGLISSMPDIDALFCEALRST
jgi:4,5-dihydroxyphthalate decarboxylase